MKLKKLSGSIFFILCMILVSFFSCQSIAAADNTGKIVRVAYYDLGNYYQKASDGGIDSYDSVYLDMVANYTGYEFEYIDCGTWDRAIERLENHEVDLVGTMQWNMEREQKYSICETSYGYAVAELATLPESDYIYEDYAQLSDAVIGYVQSYEIENQLQTLMEQQHFTAKIKTFESQLALEEALKSGKIDIIAANAHAMQPEWKVIAKFSYMPFYFASWKGNDELINNISEAIVKINLYQEEFDDGLIKKYFSSMVNSPYNKEELDCIAKNEVHTIYFDDETKPLAWYDEETDTMNGILIDICAELEEKTGLHFNIRPLSEKTSDHFEHSASYYTFSSDFEAPFDGTDGKTETILAENFFFYRKLNHTYISDPQNKYKVAVPKKRSGCIAHLENNYPGYEIVEYDTPMDCIRHLQKDEVELALLSGYVADNILITNDINDIVSIPVSEFVLEMGLAFEGSDKETIANIVNKGHQLIGTERINEIKLKNASGIVPDTTLRYFIKSRPLETFIVGFVFIALLLLSISLVLYARVIEEKNQKITEADQARMDFFSRMSHDMRTPMNGILGMARLSKAETDIDVMQHNMDMVEKSGTYMLSLINDTLDLQKIEAGKMQLQKEVTAFGPFMESVADMVRATASQKNITFQMTTDMEFDYYINVDAVRLKQIFSNLLSNAIKFTPRDGCVEFCIKRLGRTSTTEQDCFIVRDTGIGISQEFMQTELFTAYSQEHNSITKQNAGSGLGLAITKNLVELMGGRIEVDSELGEGTVFTVYLDFEIVDKKTAESSLSKEKSIYEQVENRLHGKKILLCEDHPLNAEVAQRLLEKVGCTVTWATDGEKGVKEFSESEPGYYDAILMDIRMPNMDGYTAAQEIRKLERWDAAGIPIIAMTANAYQEDIEHSMEVGMNVHLSKPIAPKQLYRTLSEQLD